MTLEIRLSQGKSATVDDIDSDLATVKWHAYKAPRTYYAMRHYYSSGKQKRIRMHRVILSRILGRELLPREQVDHADHNGLNNRRENLRLATDNQNQCNQQKHNGRKSSKYKGVCWDKHNKKWEARIMVARRQIHLGRFDREEDARDAYDAAAIRYFGPFVYTNAMMAEATT